MSINTSLIVSKVWSFCNPLGDVGVGYGECGVNLTFDKIEETIAQSLMQSETLRQSILKRAFEGKLVSRNNDSDAGIDNQEIGIAAESSMKF
jgi:hypothetical protein